MKKLSLLAGPSAYARIMDHGLQPADVDTIIGASGAAKWLTICGLDRAVFGKWLHGATHAIDLYGTSIGAFKLAAAAQVDSDAAIMRLAEAYIDQHYPGPISPQVISLETTRIINILLPSHASEEILASPNYRFHCGAVRCHGGLTSRNGRKQKLAMVAGFVESVFGKRAFRNRVERIVFGDPRSEKTVQGHDGYKTCRVALTRQNFVAALLASGSIPVFMDGVEHVSGAGDGVYRDGGLLDYHPVPSNFWSPSDGIVLYPHFYNYLKSGWFDKFFPWRKVKGGYLDNVLLVSPSEAYVTSLPGGRIPRKEDFRRFKNDDKERMRRWQIVMERSCELGDEFLEIVTSGKIKQRLNRLPE
jgi:hypothetical protein